MEFFLKLLPWLLGALLLLLYATYRWALAEGIRRGKMQSDRKQYLLGYATGVAVGLEGKPQMDAIHQRLDEIIAKLMALHQKVKTVKDEKLRLLVRESSWGWFCESICDVPVGDQITFVGYEATRWEAVADWHNWPDKLARRRLEDLNNN